MAANGLNIGGLTSSLGSFAGSMAASNQASFQAGVARSQVAGVFGMATLDIASVNNRLSISLGEISNKIRTTTGTQLARAASTGFSVSSKSFLSVMANTSNVLLHQAKQARTTAELERQRIWYAAQLRATQLENSARLQDMRASAASQQGMFSLLGGIGRLFN